MRRTQTQILAATVQAVRQPYRPGLLTEDVHSGDEDAFDLPPKRREVTTLEHEVVWRYGMLCSDSHDVIEVFTCVNTRVHLVQQVHHGSCVHVE